ncbi:MAG: EcsC family protein [Fibromonadales bacterium]|nr:EcsC family protein [Fibromonadales bacterium]
MPKLTETIIQQALEFAYNAGSNSAIELAEKYKKLYPGSKLEQVNALIRWQVANGAAAGFATGLGGLVTLPVTIPANLASVLYIQMRMISAIAIIGGYDPKDDRVKTFAFSCLAGNVVKDALKEIGIEVGKQFVLKNVIEKISEGVFTRINRAVGYGLLAKFGAKGAANLGKMVPLVGGLIGGAMDGVWVVSVGKIAKSLFINDSDFLIETETKQGEEDGISH